ncbi:hypothetical protein [Thermocatellispora tengchongensis]|uniref:hypothetical protein n=1 Tax=Thermocatellispora tengchongensis TaxID=1073253 RepID=UPI00362F886C
MPKQQIRPKLTWVWLSWVVAILCLIGGVAGGVAGLFGSVSDVAPATPFAPGQTASVTLDPADQPALYIATDQNVNYECSIDNGGKLTRSAVSQNVTVNNVNWQLILNIEVPKAGTYKVACATQENAPDVRFGVGRNLGDVASGLGGSVAVLFGVPTAGFLFAIIVTIVVLVRRSGARKRLAASAAGVGGPPPGPYGG